MVRVVWPALALLLASAFAAPSVQAESATECVTLIIVVIDPSHPSEFDPSCIPVVGGPLCDFVDCATLSTFVESGSTLVVGAVCTVANCDTVENVFWFVIETILDLTALEIRVQADLPPMV